MDSPNLHPMKVKLPLKRTGEIRQVVAASNPRHQVPAAMVRPVDFGDTRSAWAQRHPLQTSTQTLTRKQLNTLGQHQDCNHSFNLGGWDLQQDTASGCKDRPQPGTASKGGQAPLRRVQAPKDGQDAPGIGEPPPTTYVVPTNPLAKAAPRRPRP